MKLKEIIQRVQSLYSKGVQSDDSRLSNRHIYNKILTLRSRLIAQQHNKKQKISQWNYQTIPCIELIKVPANDCPCIPPIGCDVLRSKYELPEPLTGLSNYIIQSVFTIDRSIRLDEISVSAVNYQKGNKYSSKKINYYIHNNYIYVTASSSSIHNLKFITLTAIFEDPFKANEFKTFCDEGCTDCKKCNDFLEEDFPIDNDLIDTVVEMCIPELIQLFSQNIEDLTNNSRDSLKEQSK
jgi:hypothetical protein